MLADAYLRHGDYRHVPDELLRPGARIGYLVAMIAGLQADVIGLQEAEPPLVHELSRVRAWQVFWTQKEEAPDGCLTLVKKNLSVRGFNGYHYADGSGHVLQMLTVDGILIANTHIKWELQARLAQTRALLDCIGSAQKAVILADCNDRPGGPARELVTAAGFMNVPGDTPTAFIANRDGPAALDLLAVRGLTARPVLLRMGEDFQLSEIPSPRCPSDHIPVVAHIKAP
ncbi:MAG TPA: endonuclease/exonuclease/phosphatase family protein [Candidatus Saccharimonas sp.]|nr:endonuclease/exonuclease/phosphatase family protein [Candidatus Saccharimonas sp.]